ncbi:MAG TPA: protein kinase [Planctomycetaceae bacterium]|jgi:serine/threonine protein kinase|nr:protein kinase [Planctomycetaceae bacterium]
MSPQDRPLPQARLCPRCQAELPADAAPGLCSRCSQTAGTDATEHFVPSSAFEPTLAPRVTEPHGLQLGAAHRYFGDYEILDEIARGGMGVVYKARQLSLDRIVALKTILAGQFASEADVERFYTEARAAANLQHPNIVAIHEVGQYEGQHYFSMDYVEGRNLASFVDRGPLPVTQAVTYLKSIAEAIHFAHRHGILHRDLKPSNILIDSFDQPRITDFGIAKRIGARDLPSAAAGGAITESSLTAIGEVLGTPSYMPPEQIDADPAQLGPPTDVYSLGAILYELLTGRPPFRGPTVRDTLLAVLQSPPTSVRHLNRRAPRDLEKICLKCLQKDPSRRYSSAAALADDLERFTLGQQTQAAAEEKSLVPRIVLGSILACMLFCCGGPFVILEWFPHVLGMGEPLSQGLGTVVAEIGTTIKSSEQLDELVRSWRPPGKGSASGDLFPARVGSFVLAGRGENTAIPEFRIDLPGSSATYKSGTTSIEFFVFRATRAECQAIFTRVGTAFNDELVRVAGNETRYKYKFAGHVHSGLFVRSNDQLLLARTADGAKPDEFLTTYLKATAPTLASARSADEAPADEDGEQPVSSTHSYSVRGTVILLISLSATVAVCAGVWKAYAKAGLPGWGSLIPIYNLVLLMRLAGKPGWWAVWLFVPYLNLVIYTIVTFEVAKNFGKGVAYTLGLLLLPPVFYAMLGLGQAEYNATLLRLRQQAAAV